MLKFTRRLLAASRYTPSNRRTRRGRSFGAGPEQLESRELLAADFFSSTGQVEQHSPLVSEGEGELVGFNLKITDTAGNPITSIGANQDFQVRVFTEDLRTISESDAGVVSAYMNLLFDSNLVSFVGPITFAADYPFLPNAGTVGDGVITNINSAADITRFLNGNALGSAEVLFLTAPFRSNAATALNVTAVDDTLTASGGANTLNVLANDVAGGTAQLSLDASTSNTVEILLFTDNGGTTAANPDPSAGEVAYGSSSIDITGAGGMTITGVGNATNGTVGISNDGLSVIYTPTAGFAGNDSFSYTISNGNGSTSTATANVSVSATAPDLVAFAQALAADGNISFFGAAWCPFCTEQKQLFEDGADFLPFVEVTNPDRSLNQIGQDNNITKFPTWIFQDGTRREAVLSLEEISTLSGIAIPQSSTPFLAEIPNSVVLDGAPLHLALNGYDPNGGPLTYTIKSNSNPSVVNPEILSGNRSLRFDMVGYEDMVFQLFDHKVKDITDIIGGYAADGTYDDVIFHRVLNNFVIQGGDPTGTGSGDPSLPNFDDHFDFDLQHVQTGLLSMAKAGDDTNSSQFFVTEGPSRHLDFNHSIFGILVEGEKAREAISNTAVANGGRPVNEVKIDTASVFMDTENGVLFLKAVAGQTGTSDITITVTDGEGNSFDRTFTVTIQPDTSNGGPFLSVIPTDITTTVDTPVNIQLEGNDVEGDPVVFSAIPTGSVTGTQVSVNNTTGVVTVTPPAGFVGTLQVLMRVTSDPSVGDDRGSVGETEFDEQVVSITVLDLTAPTGIDLLNTSDTGLSPTDNITNASTLEFEVTGVTTGRTVQLFRTTLVGGVPDTSTTTMISETTAASTSVVATVNFDSTVSDGIYAITAIQLEGSNASVASTALNVTLDRTLPANFTSTPPTDIAAGSELVYNITNGDESGLSYFRITQDVAGLTLGEQSGELRWTPTEAQEGPQTIVVRAVDVAGNFRDQTINLTVQDAVRPAFTDSYSVDEDNTLTVNAANGVLANDNNGTTAGLTASVINDVTNGTLTLSADGSFVYTPDADFSGTDTFTYRFSNDTGDSNEAIVVITVNNLNDAPIANNDTYSVVEDGTLNIGVDSGVLANDTDQENDALTAAVLQTTTNGTLTLNANGSFTYVPNANFAGSDSFTYTANDGNGGTDTATVTITVTGVNDAPVAVNDSYTVNEDATLTVNAADGILTNDTDVDSADLNAFVVVNPTNGTLTLNSADGSFTYVPNANFFGTDTFTYRANDNTINSANIATVTITVVSQPDPPTASADTATVFRGATAERIDVLANDTTEPDGTQAMTVTAVGTGSQSGTLAIIENGAAVAYTPAAGFSGTETFSYTITDADGLTDTATLTITVQEFTPSSLAGFAYIDANNNGIFDSTELALGGVTITLTGTDANSVAVNRTAITGSDGSYTFGTLTPGTYTLTESQPLFLIDGIVTVGSQGGTASTNVINVTLAEGTDGTANNFGEMGRLSSTANMNEWFSSTPRGGIISSTDTVSGQRWFYVESGWDANTAADFDLADDLATGTLTINYPGETAQTATLSNGTAGDYTIYASDTTSHLVRIHGSASQLGLSSTASASSTSEGEGEASSFVATATNGLTSEGEFGDFQFDTVSNGSLSSEGEAEENASDDDSSDLIDVALLDLDTRTMAEQKTDGAVDAASDALAGDDVDFNDLLDKLAAE